MRTDRYLLILLSCLMCDIAFSADILSGQAAQAIRGPAAPSAGVEPIPPEPQPTIAPFPFIKTKPGETLAPEAARISFVLKKLIIINPTVFSESDLICPFQDKIGKKITLGELQAIANEITTRYQKEGFILTRAILPEQHISDGTATLQVICGHIDKITVKGTLCPTVKLLIEEYAEPIRRCIPLKMKRLERYTLLINDIPGVTARAYLTPSKTIFGTADLIIDTSQEWQSSHFNVNNFGSPYLGPVQYSVSNALNSVFMPGDSTQIQAVTTANRKLNYAQLQHTELLNREGLRYSALGRIVEAKPGLILAPLRSQGSDRYIYNELHYPIIRTREENLFISGGFTFINDKVRVLGATLYYDRTRPIHATVSYSLLDRFQGVTTTDVTLSHGLKILHASSKTLLSRFEGKSNYTKWNGSLTREQLLPYHFSLMAAVQGQFSYHPLLSISQFTFGGPAIGRGYDPSEILGDRGIIGSGELRYTSTSLSPKFQLFQYYAFYDSGRVWNLKPNSSSQVNSASSCGVGLRLTFLKRTNMNFYIAKPLTARVNSKNNRQARLYFSLYTHL